MHPAQSHSSVVTPFARDKGKIDFRYAPSFWQSTYCFPDDAHKSLVGKNGELLFGHGGVGAPLDVFSHVVSVRLRNAGEGVLSGQRMESPGVPIITTSIAYPSATLHLTSFATKSLSEGRVDNLLVEIEVNSDSTLECSASLCIGTQQKLWLENTTVSPTGECGMLRHENEEGPVFLVVDTVLETDDSSFFFHPEPASADRERRLRVFARFPRDGQELGKVINGLSAPFRLLGEARDFWKSWKATEGTVLWQLDSQSQNFLTACARNIVQAREIKGGKKLFRVGTTIYRGLWVVDGNFLLEASRYLGQDKEAQEGLESIWSLQRSDGGIFAGAGEAHWKDTAVALLATARQAELAQDWKYFVSTWSQIMRAVVFLRNLRDKARGDGTANGKYGLLPCGYGDSGIGGIRSEFTNTLWTLIGLKAILEAGQMLSMPEISPIDNLYRELFESFLRAARVERKQHPGGFSYLPMLMKDDPKWQEPDERLRPRPQAAQVYLSQAIYPGLLFARNDPLVEGHFALMKSITKEGIPSETGWLSDNAVWTYNAPVVAQAYLWAGMRELARQTFEAFLNHASPLFSWREEQSLVGVQPQRYIGDMPHNWASAECIRFLRHMFILEDGSKMRLFEGLVPEDFAGLEPFALKSSPTKWGRVSLTLEPEDSRTWSATFEREIPPQGFSPSLTATICPQRLFGLLPIHSIQGAHCSEHDGYLSIDPLAPKWQIRWEG